VKDRKGTVVSKVVGEQSTDTLSRIVDLLVEHKIRLDAWEHVLKETNPLLHEHYLGTIENLQTQKAAEARRALIQMLESKPAAN
jgi:hypothetical protein